MAPANGPIPAGVLKGPEAADTIGNFFGAGAIHSAQSTVQGATVEVIGVDMSLAK